MRHGLISPINTVFSRQSHCINCGEIRPFYFSLTGQQCGIVLAIHAIMTTRTASGAVAWSVSLVTMPFVAVRAYLVLGRKPASGFTCFTTRSAAVVCRKRMSKSCAPPVSRCLRSSLRRVPTIGSSSTFAIIAKWWWWTAWLAGWAGGRPQCGRRLHGPRSKIQPLVRHACAPRGAGCYAVAGRDPG